MLHFQNFSDDELIFWHLPFKHASPAVNWCCLGLHCYLCLNLWKYVHTNKSWSKINLRYVNVWRHIPSCCKVVYLLKSWFLVRKGKGGNEVILSHGQCFLDCRSSLAAWSSVQSHWLLIKESQVRFPALSWDFSLNWNCPAVCMDWVLCII